MWDNWPHLLGGVLGKLVIAGVILGIIWLVKRLWNTPTRDHATDTLHERKASTTPLHVTEVCRTLRIQFEQLKAPPSLVLEVTAHGPALDHWLLGYVSGLYEAACQHQQLETEPDELRHIYAEFYGEKSAEAAVKEYFAACISLQSAAFADSPFSDIYDAFQEGRITGGTNLMDWLKGRTAHPPLGLYRKYA